jgi:Transcriptional regulatory protein, C terminal
VKLKFSGQPFQVLAILLERPGDVVTREELRKRLWPDTFVDVECRAALKSRIWVGGSLYCIQIADNAGLTALKWVFLNLWATLSSTLRVSTSPSCHVNLQPDCAALNGEILQPANISTLARG